MNRPSVRLTESPWRFPAPEVLELANGLTVWYFPMPGQHVAALELMQPIRLDDEPRAKEGVATIALHAIDESTRSNPDVQELLDLQGAAIHASAGLHSSRFGAHVPARRLDGFLPLLAEVLTEPAYLSDDIVLHVEAQEASYRTRLSSPGAAAKWAFRVGLHGTDQRNGRPMAGTPETLYALERDDIVAWHAAQYSPVGSTLILAGDLPELDLSALEAWTGDGARSPLTEPRTNPGRTVIVDVPGSVQATILIGTRSIARTDPRWAPARLAGHVLCGGFASRLNLELRERLGYTYGVSGGFGPDPIGSLLQISTSTRTEVAGDTVERILKGMALDDDITDDELEDAKAYRIGIAPLANETSADIASQALALAEAGMSTEFVNDHMESLRDVTPAEATDVWRSLLRREDLVIAVAGDAAALRAQLAHLDPEVIELG